MEDAKSTTWSNVITPSTQQPVDIIVNDGTIKSIQPTSTTSDEPPSFLIPSLCHPHIHLDKPYLLTCSSSHGPHHEQEDLPDYSDLNPTKGDFQEALKNTSYAKERYTPDDLYRRGAQLLAASHHQGVTHVRAFVEVDHVVGLSTVAAGVRLQTDFAHLLALQLCVFAQDPIQSGPHGTDNRELVLQALATHRGDVDVLGTTPYVESGHEAAVTNVRWAVQTALEWDLHLDFHIDYDLDQAKAPDELITAVIVTELMAQNWCARAKPHRTVVLGHGTRLTVLDEATLRGLADKIRHHKLPIHFVGLPTSDLYMMGREKEDQTSPSRPWLQRVRGTLDVPSLIKRLGLNSCLGVNNVGNAFTPYGTGDPLALACWGVGLFHAGTVADTELLYSCVSWRARRAIGFKSRDAEDYVQEGAPWESMLLIRNTHAIELPAAVRKQNTEEAQLAGGVWKIPARQTQSIKEVVWEPPELTRRSVLKQ